MCNWCIETFPLDKESKKLWHAQFTSKYTDVSSYLCHSILSYEMLEMPPVVESQE